MSIPAEQQFYDHYAKMKKYTDIVTRIWEECEFDAQKKYELQIIPPQPARRRSAGLSSYLRQQSIINPNHST